MITKTATPVEFDQVRRQLTRLATSLAPTAHDHRGALGGAVRTADANLTGNAAQLNTMLHQLSLASDTLSSSRGDLFGKAVRASVVPTDQAQNRPVQPITIESVEIERVQA